MNLTDKIKFISEKCQHSITIYFNLHKETPYSIYEYIETIKDSYKDCDFTSSEIILCPEEEIISNDSLWEIHYYPLGSNGSYYFVASTLEKLIDTIYDIILAEFK